MRLWSLIGIAMLGTASAAAQTAGRVELSALGLVHGKTSVLDGNGTYGFSGRLGVWLPARFEAEASFDYSRPAQVRSIGHLRMLHAGASLLYNIPAGSATVYARVGYGRFFQWRCHVTVFDCSNFSASTVGAGVKVPVTDWLGFRLEVARRQRPAYDYSAFAASAGFILGRFGSKAGAAASPKADRPAAPIAPVRLPAGVRDSDRDGVPDRRDKCAATPLGALVDARGCPTDSDGDGVFDGVDRCPATPPGAKVDAVGCPVKKPE